MQTMETIDEALAHLRELGYKIGTPYVQTGIGGVGGRIYVVVNDIAMTFIQAKALANGRLTLEQIGAQNV